MKTYLAAALLALVFALPHTGDAEEEAFPSFDSNVVGRGAMHTWANYVKWWNETRGTPLQGDMELETHLWAEGVAKLKPAYVYTHGVNIVIVRSLLDGEDEEGFYVALGISSGPGPNDELFTRMLIAQSVAGSVHTFRRDGHFERTPTEKQEKTTPNKGMQPTK